MEGVKILSEEMIKNFGGDTIFPILIVAGLFLLIFGVCLLGKCCYGSEERFWVLATTDSHLVSMNQNYQQIGLVFYKMLNTLTQFTLNLTLY